jgi:hypothetical protein
MKNYAAMAGAIALAVASASAQAISTLNFAGDGALGDFTGILSIAAVDTDTATLTISLTNSATTSAGGKITGFVLNNPGDAITSISGYSTNKGSFEQLGLSNSGISAAPNGGFDLGAALGGAFLGGGSPNPGIVIGETGTFTFTLEGANVDTLVAQDFFDELSANAQGGGPLAFDVRFRGFTNGGSDKVPGTPVIPEPSTYAILGIGLGLLGFAAKRRRKV